MGIFPDAPAPGSLLDWAVMSSPYAFHNPNVRLSDSERHGAMSALGQAFAEGRLSMDEYDNRCTSITRAQSAADLAPVFHDLPQSPRSTAIDHQPVYSVADVDNARRASRRTRAGLMGLTTIGTIVATPLLMATVAEMAGLLFFVIPTVFILLYVMKIGPASWHQPSPRQIEREKMRQIQIANAQMTAERRALEDARQAEIRARRRELTGELTNEAMGFAKKSLGRFKK